MKLLPTGQVVTVVYRNGPSWGVTVPQPFAELLEDDEEGHRWVRVETDGSRLILDFGWQQAVDVSGN